jgi:hypothetical protein
MRHWRESRKLPLAINPFVDQTGKVVERWVRPNLVTGGKQLSAARIYNRHEYLEEKRKALMS